MVQKTAKPLLQLAEDVKKDLSVEQKSQPVERALQRAHRWEVVPGNGREYPGRFTNDNWEFEKAWDISFF